MALFEACLDVGFRVGTSLPGCAADAFLARSPELPARGGGGRV